MMGRSPPSDASSRHAVSIEVMCVMPGEHHIQVPVAMIPHRTRQRRGTPGRCTLYSRQVKDARAEREGWRGTPSRSRLAVAIRA